MDRDLLLYRLGELSADLVTNDPATYGYGEKIDRLREAVAEYDRWRAFGGINALDIEAALLQDVYLPEAPDTPAGTRGFGWK